MSGYTKFLSHVDKKTKRKFEEQFINTLFINIAFEEKNPEKYKLIYKDISNRLEQINVLQKKLDFFKKMNGSKKFNISSIINIDNSTKEEMEFLRNNGISEIEKEKAICDEKLNFIEFICNSFNCNKEQITMSVPYSSRVYYSEIDLTNNVQVHIGNFHFNFNSNEMVENIVFPRIILGDFNLFLSPTFDFTKVVYPEFIMGIPLILPDVLSNN